MCSSMAYIVDDCVGFGYQASYGGCMDNLAVAAIQSGPKVAQVQLELIESESADAVQNVIKMILEPGPNFSSGDALRGSRVCSDGFFDGWEVRHMADGLILLCLHE